ncbi:MAG: response regulator [Gemmatimonadetes bacterium]|nr:type II/IV secretion system protein [Gemmatimonadota bacterium]NIR78184.1 type II/IV secretion system protein [Gemmatimonadota bacterium]NIT89039.1 type II/IV secretion system protein [Gemmatimonadota bacterium]NIU30636.1 type II/IV secretion system protein [Gemmatimonadota bacterium]NIU35442.1 response regulator [Gemmatimonadota bacterium]
MSAENAPAPEGGAPGTASEAAPPGHRPRPVHWLVRIVDRAGIERSQELEVPPGTPARDAWGMVARALQITEDELAELVAEYFRLDVADIVAADPNAALLIPEAMARKHLVYPVGETDRAIAVATCDPTDVEAERAVGFTTGRTTIFRVAPPSAIQEAIDARFSPEHAVESILGNLELDEVGEDAVKLVEEMGPEEITESDVQATPVVKLTNLIIRDGISQGASDIHIEPGRKVGAVRYRVDGVLRKHMDLPMSALNRVISRVKILSNLDIADRLRPQDGKARVRIGNLNYDLRISTLPAGGAEKCVIRILDSSKSLNLDDLDFPSLEIERLRDLLVHREGIVVVTGPTGSGKTTTLYAALRELADGKVNITTVEDPIEYELPAITQTQVEPKQGLTFASALRSILRQDPDVILVGEIRDPETAKVAIQAAMTGHLVLATVHANDAVSAVARLADLDLQHSTISQTLRGAVAQRLVRRACPACAEPVRGQLTPDEQRLTERHGMEPVVRAVGCTECGFTGYRGRLPVVEVMTAGPRLQGAIEQRKGWATLTRVATQGGMRTMHQVALDQVVQGKTTLVEVERVLGQVIEEEPEEAETGPPRVLVVDDEEDARIMIRTLLEREDYVVAEAEDGKKAIEILEKDPGYDLVVLDLQMPEMDGYETLKWIRGNVQTTALPVLVRTGTGSDEIEAELLRAGADDYVDKSVDAPRFLARVGAVIRRTRV